jgi:hypothetical protein
MMEGLRHSDTGRYYGHSVMALSKTGPHLPLPQAGGPRATSLGTPTQHSRGMPQSAGGREDASEGLGSPQTLPDIEATRRRRQEQAQRMANGQNPFSSGSISDQYRFSNADYD